MNEWINEETNNCMNESSCEFHFESGVVFTTSCMLGDLLTSYRCICILAAVEPSVLWSEQRRISH